MYRCVQILTQAIKLLVEVSWFLCLWREKGQFNLIIQMKSHYGFNSLFLLKSITRYHYCPLSYRWQCPLALWSESCVLIGYPAHLSAQDCSLWPRARKENCSRWTYKKVRFFLTVCAVGSLKALKIVKLRKHNGSRGFIMLHGQLAFPPVSRNKQVILDS